MERSNIVRNVKIAVVALATILFIIVVAKNFEYVKVDFLLIRIDMPLALLVAITFMLGAGAGFLAGGFFIRQRLAGKAEGK